VSPKRSPKAVAESVPVTVEEEWPNPKSEWDAVLQELNDLEEEEERRRAEQRRLQLEAAQVVEEEDDGLYDEEVSYETHTTTPEQTEPEPLWKAAFWDEQPATRRRLYKRNDFVEARIRRSLIHVARTAEEHSPLRDLPAVERVVPREQSNMLDESDGVYHATNPGALSPTPAPISKGYPSPSKKNKPPVPQPTQSDEKRDSVSGWEANVQWEVEPEETEWGGEVTPRQAPSAGTVLPKMDVRTPGSPGLGPVAASPESHQGGVRQCVGVIGDGVAAILPEGMARQLEDSLMQLETPERDSSPEMQDDEWDNGGLAKSPVKLPPASAVSFPTDDTESHVSAPALEQLDVQALRTRSSASIDPAVRVLRAQLQSAETNPANADLRASTVPAGTSGQDITMWHYLANWVPDTSIGVPTAMTEWEAAVRAINSPEDTSTLPSTALHRQDTLSTAVAQEPVAKHEPTALDAEDDHDSLREGISTRAEQRGRVLAPLRPERWRTDHRLKIAGSQVEISPRADNGGNSGDEDNDGGDDVSMLNGVAFRRPSTGAWSTPQEVYSLAHATVDGSDGDDEAGLMSEVAEGGVHDMATAEHDEGNSSVVGDTASAPADDNDEEEALPPQAVLARTAQTPLGQVVTREWDRFQQRAYASTLPTDYVDGWDLGLGALGLAPAIVRKREVMVDNERIRVKSRESELSLATVDREVLKSSQRRLLRTPAYGGPLGIRTLVDQGLTFSPRRKRRGERMDSRAACGPSGGGSIQTRPWRGGIDPLSNAVAAPPPVTGGRGSKDVGVGPWDKTLERSLTQTLPASLTDSRLGAVVSIPIVQHACTGLPAIDPDSLALKSTFGELPVRTLQRKSKTQLPVRDLAYHKEHAMQQALRDPFRREPD